MLVWEQLELGEVVGSTLRQLNLAAGSAASVELEELEALAGELAMKMLEASKLLVVAAAGVARRLVL